MTPKDAVLTQIGNGSLKRPTSPGAPPYIVSLTVLEARTVGGRGGFQLGTVPTVHT
jgi:hypothetical protein